MYVLFSVLLLVLFVGALVNIIMCDKSSIRYLPKLVWILLVILLPLIGSILWFAVGREYSHPVNLGGFGDPRRRETDAAASGGWSRSVSAPGALAPRPSNPGAFAAGDTEAELAALEREIAASEREDRIRRLEAELRARRDTEKPGD